MDDGRTPANRLHEAWTSVGLSVRHQGSAAEAAREAAGAMPAMSGDLPRRVEEYGKACADLEARGDELREAIHTAHNKAVREASG